MKDIVLYVISKDQKILKKEKETKEYGNILIKNKIKKPKWMTIKQMGEVEWIINILSKANSNAISSVNCYFKDYKITYRYKIKIKVKKDAKR